MGNKNNRGKGNKDVRTLPLWPPKPSPTLADEVRALKATVGILTANVKILKCELKNMKSLINNGSE